MSEIPFITQLGDELERTARRASAPRRRRLAIFAAIGALALSGSAAATGLFSFQAEQQATNSIACYASPDGRNVLDTSPTTSEIGTLSAVGLCGRELTRAGYPARRLVACSGGAQVAVIPGRTSADCVAAGLAALPADYARAQARTVRLERELLRIEASADCLAPARFAARVQAALDRLGWTGWRAVVHDMDHGPCGTLSNVGGDGRRRFTGSYQAADRRIVVRRSAPRRLTDLLFAAPHGLVGPLIRHSGSRCFTVAELRADVERTFRGTGVAARVQATSQAFPPNASLVGDDGRWARYQQGCAIAVGATPGRDGRSATIEVWLRP